MDSDYDELARAVRSVVFVWAEVREGIRELERGRPAKVGVSRRNYMRFDIQTVLTKDHGALALQVFAFDRAQGNASRGLSVVLKTLDGTLLSSEQVNLADTLPTAMVKLAQAEQLVGATIELVA